MKMLRLHPQFARVLLLVTGFCLAAQAAHAQREEPWQLIGVWNLNFERSALFEGAPPQTRTLKYWWAGDTLKHTVHLVTATGEHTLGGWMVDRNLVTLPPATITLKRVDTHVSQIISKRDGKVTGLLTRIASKDGRNVTFVRQRPDAEGVMSVYGVEVFDKQ
jgi:hypothetical protein